MQARTQHGANRRRFLLVVLYLVAAAPFLIKGALAALATQANSPLDWVTSDFAPRADFEEFQQRFGRGDVVIISWPGCTLSEPRLDELATALRDTQQFRDVAGASPFAEVTTGREVLAALTAGLQVPPDLALDRLRGIWVGPDGKTTCVLIRFTEAGLSERGRLVPLIEDAVTQQCQVAAEEIHLAGPVIDGLSVDLAGKAALDRFALPSAALVFVLAWICLRSFRAATVVFLSSVIAQVATLALVHYSGHSMSAVLIVLPPLIQVLAIAGGIHFANYYFDAARETDLQQAPWVAFKHGWLPALLSSGTTAVGLASLMLSQLTPIREFGAFGAAGTILITAFLLAIVPAVFTLWPARRRSTASAPTTTKRRSRRPAKLIAPSFARRYVRGLFRLRDPLIFGWLAAAAVASLGLRDCRTSVRIETLFPSDSRILRDYAWLEDHLGPLVPIEIVLRCDATCPLSPVERLRLVSRVEDHVAQISARQRDAAIRSGEPVVFGGVLSPLSFAPANGWNQPSTDPRAAAQVSLTGVATPPTCGEAFPWLNASAFYRQEIAAPAHPGDKPVEFFRTTLYVSALHEVDYAALLQDVRDHVDPLLADSQGRSLAGVTANYTGIMPLVHAIQKQLMTDLATSLLSAVAVIALVMIIVQAGVRAGLVTMIPNLVPSLFLFGFLGWSHTPLDIGSVMTASLALGMAIDDTLHFVTFYRRRREAGRSNTRAITEALSTCGGAMVQTSIICGLGLVVFAASDFGPTSRFGGLMCGLIAAALLADVVLMPAILLGPLERLFAPDRVRRAAA